MNTILRQHPRYEPAHRLRHTVASILTPPSKSPFGFPSGDDREFWQAVGAQHPDALYGQLAWAAADRQPASPVQDDWLEYSNNGDRQPWERKLNVLTADCSALAITLALTDDRRLVPPLVANLETLLALPSWCLPDHYALPASGERPPLPDPSHPVLDIAAGWIAGIVALTAHLAGHQLPPALVRRAADEVRRRVLIPWRDQSAYWHGLEAPPNNWAPWIASNVALATAFAETDASRRHEDLLACAELVDRFLAGYGEDGACEEGPAYWWWATATSFEAITAIENVYGAELLPVVSSDLRAQASFIVDMHIGRDRYANFGDSSSAIPPQASWALLANLADRTRNDRAQDHADSMIRVAPHPGSGSLSNAAVRHVYSLTRHERAAKRRAPQYASFAYYPSQQLFIARESLTLGQGLTLFAKAGNNGVSHNHNDVGSFILGVDGEPVLLDLGAATYNRETFSEHTRYLSPATRSSWHNVPIVAGDEQMAGGQYAASEVKIIASDERKALALSFDGCYPPSSQVQHLRREIALTDRRRVELSDRWIANQAITVSQVFVTNHRPELLREQVRVGPLALRFAQPITFEVDELPVAEPKFTKDWGPAIYRLRAITSPATSGRAAVHITRE